MILDAKSMAWQLEVAEMALRAGWTVYDQTTRNRRQHAPSLILFRGGCVILAYLRTARPERTAQTVELVGQRTGLVTKVWTPADRALIAATIA